MENLNLQKQVVPITQDDLTRWYTLQQQISQLKDEEMNLRLRICATFFSQPKQGTNRYQFIQGWEAVAQFNTKYELDKTAFNSIGDDLREQGVNIDCVVKYTPELNSEVFKALPDQTRKQIEQIVTIKHQAPQLAIQPLKVN